MRRFIQFLPGSYYHVYNRGNNKQKVFLEEKNYYFFLDRLRFYFDKEAVDLCAYCLMPNHFHLLVYLNKATDFSRTMQSFSISYVKSFNRWNKHVGHLFQSEFNVKQIDEKDYLAYVTGYIHVNPVTAGLAARPDNWRFSDYNVWVSSDDTTVAGVTLRNRLFGDGGAYRLFVLAFMEEKKRQREMEKILAK